MCYKYYSQQYELNPLQLKLIIDVAIYYDKAQEKMFQLTQKAANADQIAVGKMAYFSSEPESSTIIFLL